MPEISLTVHGTADPSRVDAFTRALGQDLRRVSGVVVTRPTAAAPDGAKAGELAVIGSLVLSAVFSAQTVEAIVQLLIARIQAKAGWSVVLRRGDAEVTLTGPVPDGELERAARLLAEISE